jgi:hypothetical protein
MATIGDALYNENSTGPSTSVAEAIDRIAQAQFLSLQGRQGTDRASRRSGTKYTDQKGATVEVGEVERVIADDYQEPVLGSSVNYWSWKGNRWHATADSLTVNTEYTYRFEPKDDERIVIQGRFNTNEPCVTFTFRHTYDDANTYQFNESVPTFSYHGKIGEPVELLVRLESMSSSNAGTLTVSYVPSIEAQATKPPYKPPFDTALHEIDDSNWQFPKTFHTVSVSSTGTAVIYHHIDLDFPRGLYPALDDDIQDFMLAARFLGGVGIVGVPWDVTLTDLGVTSYEYGSPSGSNVASDVLSWVGLSGELGINTGGTFLARCSLPYLNSRVPCRVRLTIASPGYNSVVKFAAGLYTVRI